MNVLKTCAAVFVGFLLGTLPFHAATAKAAQDTAELVHVGIYPVTMLDAKTPVPQNLPGGRIAGISCISKPEKKTPDSAVCYVATTLN
jgi:hypothetical protein